MSDKEKSMRSPLGIARGMGAARQGTEHWKAQRYTALALIPVALYVLIGFVNNVVGGGYTGAMYWLQSPLSSTFVILFLLAGLAHAVIGLQVVIEDYVHCPAVRIALLLSVKIVAAALAILGILSVAKIFFGV